MPIAARELVDRRSTQRELLAQLPDNVVIAVGRFLRSLDLSDRDNRKRHLLETALRHRAQYLGDREAVVTWLGAMVAGQKNEQVMRFIRRLPSLGFYADSIPVNFDSETTDLQRAVTCWESQGAPPDEVWFLTCYLLAADLVEGEYCDPRCRRFD